MHKLSFLIELILISSFFYLGFRLIKNHSTPIFKRYYLLVWMSCSVIFPAISLNGFTLDMPISISDHSNQIVFPSLENNAEIEPVHAITDSEIRPEVFIQRDEEVAHSGMNWWLTVKMGYIIIVLFFLGRIFYGLFQIRVLKKNANPEMVDEHRVFNVDKKSFYGASFFNWIFIGSHVATEREMVISHELLHSRRFHSFDVLLSHIYSAVFWVNPFSWLLQHLITINLEYETDYLLTKNGSIRAYAHSLLNLSSTPINSLINAFSAKNMKLRIKELSYPTPQKRQSYWVVSLTVVIAFIVISCSKIDTESNFLVEEKINEIKTITTTFTSHQSDTQQKTGKIVSIATFNIDGTIDEFVSRTTYPYDRDFEVKKEFWDEPIRKNIFYIMDGLSMGEGEKSLLYGNDWPKAYYKHLVNQSKSEVRSFFSNIKISTNNVNLPTEIKTERISKMSEGSIKFITPDVVEFFAYEDNKVVRVESTKDEMNNQTTISNLREYRQSVNDKKVSPSEEKQVLANYSYEGDLLRTIVKDKYRYEFYYEKNVLTKSEYYIDDKIVNTRFHYYKDGLKERTDIFNLHNEPEYTIHYEYEFWD